MKRILIALFALIAISATAQNEKYTAAMTSALQQSGTAKDAASMEAIASTFERIGDAEKTQWLPYYYAAMIKARMSMMHTGGDPDQVADEATALINKAEAIEKNSETTCIKSMIATAKMLVDPQARWMEYGTESAQLLEEAKKQDTTNPRPFMLQAMNLKNTPKQFGGGCETAKPLAEKALALYNDFKPASELHPKWGKESVEQLIVSCK